MKVKSWVGSAGLIVIGMLIGALLVPTAGAHIGSTVDHLWREHIKPKADNRYPQGEALLFAVVNQDGSLVADRGVVSSEKLCEECRQYDLTFNRDVSGCAATATIAANPTDEFASTGQIQTWTKDDPPEEVSVVIYDSSGSTATQGEPFHLTVIC